MVYTPDAALEDGAWRYGNEEVGTVEVTLTDVYLEAFGETVTGSLTIDTTLSARLHTPDGYL